MREPDSIERAVAEGVAAAQATTVRLTGPAMALLYGMLAPLHLLMLPTDAARVLCSVAALSAVVAGIVATSGAARHRPFASAAGLGAVALTNGIVHLMLVPVPVQTTNLILVVLGTGALVLSTRIVVALVLLALSGWSLVASSRWDAAWQHFGIALGMSVLLSLVIHQVRLRAVWGMESFRVLETLRTQELEEALADAETQRWRVENALAAFRATEERLRRLTQGAVEGIVNMVEGQVLEANPAACSLLCMDEQRMVGQRLLDLFPDHERPRLALALRRGEDGPFEVACLRPGGLSMPVEIVVRTFVLDGQPVTTVSIRDISARRMAEIARDDFIAAVSHELRTPLTSVMGGLELLRSGALGEPGGDQREVLELASRNARRLEELIETLLDAKTLARGGMAFAIRHVDASEVVRNVVAQVEPAAVERRVALELLGSGPADVVTDPERLQYVVGALLSNAVKFSAPDTRVTISLETDAETVRIAVTDRGPGVPADLQERIFDRFYQADGSSARRNGGAGLGLSNARETMRRLGGEVTVCSRPGDGATFIAHIPAISALSV